ncbi:hypothetical protein PPN31119_04694 [Pandoraea pnomenusa]|uniref:Uncharacterized protein n=1 Tax=Pandoraea pnomenusa TaxID=93220 RepID=A0ABY6WQM5_9BURK|nr:hypothetical protein PPN31119_04694 [Pandoraea pnomenusa]
MLILPIPVDSELIPVVRSAVLVESDLTLLVVTLNCPTVTASLASTPSATLVSLTGVRDSR